MLLQEGSHASVAAKLSHANTQPITALINVFISCLDIFVQQNILKDTLKNVVFCVVLAVLRRPIPCNINRFILATNIHLIII